MPARWSASAWSAKASEFAACLLRGWIAGMRGRGAGQPAGRFALFAACLVACCTPALAESPAPYLAQVACLDAAGAVRPAVLPFEPDCGATRTLRVGEPLPYRKHDWPGRADMAGAPQGYQASDAVLGRLDGAPAVLHSFDFGGGARRFGSFDAGAGDGGQAVLLQDDAAIVAMTEDGSGGVQWFLGPDCRAGWLLAAAPVEAWQEAVVRLRIAPSAQDCPTRFNASLTRWRLATIALPWREAATGATGTFSASTLVSEHFGGEAVATAANLERFFLAQGLGLVRWERWENRLRSRNPGIAAGAALMAQSGRCPPMAFSDPPGPAWALVDCRTWTNFVRATPDTPLAALAWPAAGPQ